MKFFHLKKPTRLFLITPFVILASLFIVGSALLAQDRQSAPLISIDSSGHGGVITLASTSEPVIALGAWNRSGTANLTLYKANKDFLLNYLRHTNENKQIENNFDTSNFPQVAQSTQEIYQGNSDGTRVSLPLEDSGIWYLKIELNGTVNDAIIVRSTYGGIIKSMGDAFVIWNQNFVTKRSLDQVQVTVYDLTDTVKSISSGVSGNDGTLKVPFSAKADIALLEKDGQVAVLPINLKYFNSGYSYLRFTQIGTDLKYYLFTDRPLYKPGDTVYYKAIVRQDDDARYSVPTGTAKVVMYRGWDIKDVIFEKLLPVLADGSVDGQYVMPDTISPGEYTVSIQLVSDTTSGWDESARAQIQVEEYRKPDYHLEMTAPQEVYAGEDASVTIQGNYFSGQPLVGGSVSYKITSDDAYQPSTLESAAYYTNNDFRYWYSYGENIVTSTADLDSLGLAQIKLPLDTVTTAGKIKLLTVEAEYTDETGNPVQARKNILVHPGKVAIYRDDQGWKSGKAGDEYSLPVVAVPLDKNTSVAGLPLKVKIKRESWIKKDNSSQYVKEEEQLPETESTTDQKGKTLVSFIPSVEGYYLVTVSYIDSVGRFVSNDFDVWISNGEGYWNRGSYSTKISVNADKETYKLGETAQLTIFSQEPNRDVLLVFQRARVDRYQVVKLQGNTAVVPVEILDADMPNTYVRAYTFDTASNDLNSNSIDLKVSAEKKKISVNLSTDRKIYGPGDTVNLTVKTTDIKNKPISSIVTVWTVDKALFELSTDMRENIFKAFWSERYESAAEGNSLEHINFYAAEQGGGCFVAGTQVLMADGSLKSIEKVVIGDSVQTRASETDPTLVSAKVLGTHSVDENGYSIINGTLKVTPNHILWVNDTWKTASEVQADDRMVGANGEDIVIDSVEWFSQKTKVYNLTIDTYHTYFADGFWVHNQKGDVRSVLKDAAYWNPSVRTDDSGTATITFKLPDNLTTWVISGVAATSDTSVGEAKTEVITQKAVVMRPVVPNILRVGDKLNLSALLQNFTDTEKSFTTSLELPGAQIDQLFQENVTVAGNGGSLQPTWIVQPTEANPAAKATFTAKATEGDFGDAIEQPLPILPFGFTEKNSSAGINDHEYKLDVPADADEKYSSVELNLSPTMLGTLPSAMKYLIEYPYGCVEQTTSRFVPAVIAKTHGDIFADAFGDKDGDEVIKRGINRLQLLQNTDGGWGWSRLGTSDPFITAYVIEYVVAAQKLKIEVPDSLITSALIFLNSLSTNADETILKTYGLMQLGKEQGKVTVPVSAALSPDILSYAVMINVHNGDKNPDTNGVTALLNKITTADDVAHLQAGKASWFGSIDASTALGLRALTAAEVDQEKTASLARYLLQKRQKQYWSNTFATAQVIQAIVDFSQTGGDLTPEFQYTVTLNGRPVTAGRVEASTKTIKPIIIPVQDAKNGTLSIQKTGGGTLYSTLTSSSFRTDSATKAEAKGIAITREYTTGKGEEYYPSVGDTVTVRLTARNIPESVNYFVIEDQLPAGMIPINKKLKNQDGGASDYYYGGYWYNNELQAKKDGMVFLVNNIHSKVWTTTYQARVISAGQFRVPPATISDMYNPDTHGHTSSELMKITTTSERDPSKVIGAVFRRNSSKILVWLKKYKLELIAGIFVLAGLSAIVLWHKRWLRKQQDQQ